MSRKNTRFGHWEKTWFAIDGSLEKIEFEGDSRFRFTEELASLIVQKYSKKGDWILDPFCGFGTTLVASKKLGRNAVGFEIDKNRAAFAAKRNAGKVINDTVENIGRYKVPKFDLIFTSPPYLSFRHPKDPEGKLYLSDIKRIFRKIKPHLKRGGYIVIEIANLSREREFRPQAWNVGLILSKIFRLEGEIIRCDTSGLDAGGNNDHSYILIFKNAIKFGG